MTRGSVAALVPPAEETALEVARLVHMREVLSEVPKLIGTEAGLVEIAKRTQPGRSVANDPAFEPVVLFELADILPRSDIPVPKRFLQNRKLARFLVEEAADLPLSNTIPSSVPNTVVHKKPYVRAVARAVAARRAGIVMSPEAADTSEHYFRPGMMGAAAFFDFNMRDRLGRRIYDHEDRILRLARGYLQLVVPRRIALAGSSRTPTYYAATNTTADSVRINSQTGKPHKLFWTELRKDLNKFEKLRVT